MSVDIGDPDGQRWETVEALVDTGASHTVVSGTLLARLGVRPMRRWPFELADGREIEREIGYTMVRINGESAPTIVVFGPEEGKVLPGAYTLEGLRLVVDPVRRRLIHVPGLLMYCGPMMKVDRRWAVSLAHPDMLL